MITQGGLLHFDIGTDGNLYMYYSRKIPVRFDLTEGELYALWQLNIMEKHRGKGEFGRGERLRRGEKARLRGHGSEWEQYIANAGIKAQQAAASARLPLPAHRPRPPPAGKSGIRTRACFCATTRTRR